MEKSDKALSKDQLISMQVIDSNGRLLGKVQDVVFEVGKSTIALAVENKKGEVQTIPWGDVQAASDFILIKPLLVAEEQSQSQEQIKPEPVSKELGKQVCPSCGKSLTWIPQYKRWYCYNEKKYTNPAQSSKKEEWEQVFAEDKTEEKQAKKQKESTKESENPICPTCGQALTWIPQYKRWYCYNDKKYV